MSSAHTGIAAAALASLILALSGCGLKGDLYMPAPRHPAPEIFPDGAPDSAAEPDPVLRPAEADAPSQDSDDEEASRPEEEKDESAESPEKTGKEAQ